MPIVRAEIPALTLPEYRQLAARTEPSTDDQCTAFVDYVSQHHSWYKHLPLMPPGEDFHFYIHPWAGTEMLVDSKGRGGFRERVPEKIGEFWTQSTTMNYRSQFGYLAYACKAGTQVVKIQTYRFRPSRVKTGICDSNYSVPILYLEDGEPRTPPPEILEAGTVNLTATIHPLTPRLGVIERHLEYETDRLWPEDTGGIDTLEKLRLRCEEMCVPSDSAKPGEPGAGASDWVGVDNVLRQLIEPERLRLRRKMITAIKRVAELTYA